MLFISEEPNAIPGKKILWRCAYSGAKHLISLSPHFWFSLQPGLTHLHPLLLVLKKCSILLRGLLLPWDHRIHPGIFPCHNICIHTYRFSSQSLVRSTAFSHPLYCFRLFSSSHFVSNFLSIRQFFLSSFRLSHKPMARPAQ